MSTRPCRTCDAPILWAATKSGRAMPLDPTPDPNGIVVIEGGRARVLPKSERGPLGPGSRQARYTSHWTTCPSPPPRKGS